MSFRFEVPLLFGNLRSFADPNAVRRNHAAQDFSAKWAIDIRRGWSPERPRQNKNVNTGVPPFENWEKILPNCSLGRKAQARSFQEWPVL